MKAILINPTELSVKKVEFTGELQDMYRLMKCKTICAPVRFPNGDTMFANDEGWLEWTEQNRQGGFKLPDWAYPILGNVLITGVDQEGNTIGCKSSVEHFDDITFYSKLMMEIYGRNNGLIPYE